MGWHAIPVTETTSRSPVPWKWLEQDSEHWHADPGFPDKRDLYRDGYFKIRTIHAPPEYDPHGVTVRVRCAYGAEDCWDQGPDPEHDYTPPQSEYEGELIWSVTPTIDAIGRAWWIIITDERSP